MKIIKPDTLDFKSITSDSEAIDIIVNFLKFDFYTEKESEDQLYRLEEYQTGIIDSIRKYGKKMPAEEILEKARSENKPIQL